MKPLTAVLLGLFSAFSVAATASAGPQTAGLTIGYLEISGDPRYQARRRYTGLRLKERKRPVDGALLAIRESRFIGDALNVTFGLERARADSAAGLVSEIRRLRAEKAVGFFIVDAMADVLSEVAAETAGEDVLLFNVSEPSDELRGALCKPHLMHVIPSRAMVMDGLVQYLVAKRWRNVLVLKGPLPQDAVMAAAFEKSAAKFGAKVVAQKDFILGNDPRRRDRNNIALLTSGPGYDVVFLADSDGEFGRYVPYQTALPRPVVGTEGLIAEAWHWTWERHGAPQLNQRFERRSRRTMQSPDWAAWAAVKAIVESVTRTRSTVFAVVAKFLKSDKLTLDGYKGTPANFRSWNNQLRQPVLLHTDDAVVARAPLAGFLHPTNNLDTLGSDAAESRCRF